MILLSFLSGFFFAILLCITIYKIAKMIAENKNEDR